MSKSLEVKGSGHTGATGGQERGIGKSKRKNIKERKREYTNDLNQYHGGEKGDTVIIIGNRRLRSDRSGS